MVKKPISQTKRMTIAGIGHKVIPLLIMYTALTYVVSARLYPIFTFPAVLYPVITVIGLVFLALGLSLFAPAVYLILRDFPKGRLITSGPFRLVGHPIYASWVVGFIPAIALLTNNWLFLTASPLMYMLYRKLVWEEEEYLAERFGSAYRDYKKSIRIQWL